MPSFAVKLRQTVEQFAVVHVDAVDADAAEAAALTESISADFRSFYLVSAPEISGIEPS